MALYYDDVILAGSRYKPPFFGQNEDGYADDFVYVAHNVVAPGVPGIGTAVATGSTTADVPFTSPSNNGGTAIFQYRARSTPDAITGTLDQAGGGTISVTGLSPSTDYTFTVSAVNAAGRSSESSASNSITTDAGGGPSTGKPSSLYMQMRRNH